MLFNSVVFLFGFLPIAYVVFWSLRTTRWRHIWLALTGYVFYGYWNPWFALLMLFSTLVSYSAGLGFLRWSDPRRRKLCLVVPVATDLALLGFFKYANFGLDTAEASLRLMGKNALLPRLNIVLPIGISFYTFHTISYIVDSYRGTIKPTRSFPKFAAYVSLFSQLVAGPIVRFRMLEADLELLGGASRTRWLGRGVAFFVIGLVEKVIVADSIAAFVDPALAHYDLLSTTGTWLAMLGYSWQLYFDFAGYSTMAVGLGLLFGLRIPQNFNSPYKAHDPSEFWRRWHISLSTCLRDYLYIPLGGNRHGELETYRNMMLTMLIGGLWHGASWTFVIWGGVSRCIAVAASRLREAVGQTQRGRAAGGDVSARGVRMGALPVHHVRNGADHFSQDVRAHDGRAGPATRSCGARTRHCRVVGDDRSERVRDEPRAHAAEALRAHGGFRRVVGDYHRVAILALPLFPVLGGGA
ncbi:MAG TPA: MBOAT family O-acyltransferase [Gemmatimonadaceae bacterium]